MFNNSTDVCFLQFTHTFAITPAELQKAYKLAPTNLLDQKISTKNARFTTFLNLRQISVNDYEISWQHRCSLLVALVLATFVLVALVLATLVLFSC